MKKDNKVYINACSELYEVFKYIDKDILNKIPKEIINIIQNNRNKEYSFKFDKSKDLNDQDLMPETRKILSTIYLKYCCSDEEFFEIMKEHKKIEINNESKKIGLEEIENIFRESKTNSSQENQSLIKIDEAEGNWFKKIFNKIKAIFIKEGK